MERFEPFFKRMLLVYLERHPARGMEAESPDLTFAGENLKTRARSSGAKAASLHRAASDRIFHSQNYSLCEPCRYS